ncbi:MAG: ccr4 associated factor [Chaenotheca gracillima]|nr:MAG: ccr4 associated factor [Chaenotheca gracillima]
MTETNPTLEDWLDDLCVRFIINLPQEELESVERIGFAVEEAQWFYEDFARPLDPRLPSLSLRSFCLRIFQHCPLLSDFSEYHHLTAFSEFLAYKTRVPVRGAILLNDAMDEVVLVKGWKKGASWSFPRGKINKDEKDLDCAVREVDEETGFDAKEAGLTKDESEMKYIEVTMRDQNIRLYVFRGVSKDTYFEPKTRKEISKISWHSLSDLPTFKRTKQQQQGQSADDLVTNANKYYMVAPFLVPLKKWIAKQKRSDTSKSDHSHYLAPPMQSEDALTEEEPNAGEVYDHIMPRPGPAQAPPQSDVGAGREASTLLKQLLKVQSSVQAEQNAAATAAQLQEANREKSNALLALLRKSNADAPQRFSPAQHLPQTPLDHPTSLPTQPGPPRHQHLPPARASEMPPPPSFPIAPSHSTQPDKDQAFQPPASFSNPARAPRTASQARYLPNHPGSQTSQQQREPFGGAIPHGPALHQFPQQSQDTFRPPSTGESWNSQHVPQFPGTHAPNVPPATSLPAPKLTSHALNLLNAFRNTTPVHNTPQPPVERADPEARNVGRGGANEVPHPLGSPLGPPQNPQMMRHTPPKDAFSTLEASPRNGTSSRRSSQFVRSPPSQSALGSMPSQAAQRSQHQNDLLHLFRKGSDQGMLQVPSGGALEGTESSPVELSAQHSPEAAGRQVQPRAILQRPAAVGPKSKATPKPDVKGRATPDHSYKNGVVEPNGKAPAPPAVPVSILPRPISSRKQETERAQTRSKQSSPSRQATPKEEANAFQPQILRRPAVPGSPKVPEAMPHHLSFDRRGSQTAEHRQALLSLFNRPSPKDSPTSEASQPPLDALPRGLTLNTRSRQASGSDHAVPASSSKRPSQQLGSGPQTPQTPMDKSFLLGFLEGHTRSDKR